MALDKIILISNPGSASRKYAVYQGKDCLGWFHFEVVNRKVALSSSFDSQFKPARIAHIAFAATRLPSVIAEYLPDVDTTKLHAIALRIVAPSTFFQQNHIIDKSYIDRLEQMQSIAPLHIHASLSEYALLKKIYPKSLFIGVSDSEFLATKPDHAMYYGIPFNDSKKYDIKRFGYHGLSFESSVLCLKKEKLLPDRMVVCHLGGGVSVAAIKRGKLVDSTMGYSPLEGPLMATRSGTMDMIAFEVIRTKQKLNTEGIYDYFNERSGLAGVSGISSDIRDLLKQESENSRARLALDMYVYKIQQAIGAMTASMGGADTLAFTGTVGERSTEIRNRIVSKLLYLGFSIESSRISDDKSDVRIISPPRHPAKVLVVTSNENNRLAFHAQKFER